MKRLLSFIGILVILGLVYSPSFALVSLSLDGAINYSYGLGNGVQNLDVSEVVVDGVFMTNGLIGILEFAFYPANYTASLNAAFAIIPVGKLSVLVGQIPTAELYYYYTYYQARLNPLATYLYGTYLIGDTIIQGLELHYSLMDKLKLVGGAGKGVFSGNLRVHGALYFNATKQFQLGLAGAADNIVNFGNSNSSLSTYYGLFVKADVSVVNGLIEYGNIDGLSQVLGQLLIELDKTSSLPIYFGVRTLYSFNDSSLLSPVFGWKANKNITLKLELDLPDFNPGQAEFVGQLAFGF